MSQNPTPRDRLLELLADRASTGIDPAAQAELDALLAAHPDTDDDSMERAAAAAMVALTGEREPVPAGVRSMVLASIRAASDGEAPRVLAVPSVSRTASRGRGLAAWSGWLAAAACLAIAGFVVLSRPASTPGPDDARRAFVRTVGDVRVAAWGDWNDPEQKGVSGEVSWSESAQKGYMAFRGLKPNDATKEQYQLWIIDERGLGERISGGVFNASAGSGELVVEIEPAIGIRKAAAFAVTIERPGGVWVSDMSRRVVIASLKQ